MVSLGHVGQAGRRNSPTVYNAAGFVAQFWDGRSPDVEDQSKQPILNPVEMAMPDAARVVRTLRAIPGYVALFEEAFPASRPAVTYDNMALAIGAFERGLVTPGPFDAFLRGDARALARRAGTRLPPLRGAGLRGVSQRPGPGRPDLRGDRPRQALPRPVGPRPLRGDGRWRATA